jgi:hypothetical protein
MAFAEVEARHSVAMLAAKRAADVVGHDLPPVLIVVHDREYLLTVGTRR